MSATHSIYIEAPVEKVFNWFKDPRNWLTLNPAGEELTDVLPVNYSVCLTVRLGQGLRALGAGPSSLLAPVLGGS